MMLLNDFARVSRRHPCPICSRPDWCLTSRDDAANPSRVICARQESSKRMGEAGWLHRRRDGRGQVDTRIRKRKFSIRMQNTDYTKLLRSLQADLDPDLLHEFALDLGLPAESLRRFGLGLAQGDEVAEFGIRRANRIWTFPMSDASGDVVGIRVRLPNANKMCVRGSKLGLFVPTDLPDAVTTLFVTESETDAAALHALGLSAVGRPGCRSCTRLVAEFVRTRHPREVVIVADADEVGQEGAKALALHLVAFAPAVVVLRPAGAHKDARDWVRAGATQADVLAAVAQVQAMQLTVRVVRGGRR